MVAEHGDYATGDAPGRRRGRLPRAHRLLPARVSLRARRRRSARRPPERTQGGDPRRTRRDGGARDRVGRADRPARRRGLRGPDRASWPCCWPPSIRCSSPCPGRSWPRTSSCRSSCWPPGPACGRGARSVRWRWLAGAGAFTGLATLTHQNAVVLLLPLAFAAVAAVRAQHAGPRPDWEAQAAARRSRRGGAAHGRRRGPGHRPVDDPQRHGAARLRARLDRDRGDPGRHLQRRVGGLRASPLQVALRDQAARGPRRCSRGSASSTRSQLSDRLTSQALDYISAHPTRAAAAGWHNLTRMLELEGSDAWHASAAAIGLSAGTRAGGGDRLLDRGRARSARRREPGRAPRPGLAVGFPAR